MKFVRAIMVYMQHVCAKYGSDQIQCNGHRQSHAHYQRGACRY